MEGPIKARTTATLHIRTSGEVVGEIVDEYGRVVSSRCFGIMTENEFQKCLKLIEKALLEAPRASVDGW